MSQVITKRFRLSRRLFLKGAQAMVGLPPLISMFNATGTAYAATTKTPGSAGGAIPKRFVLWFNGNGIT